MPVTLNIIADNADQLVSEFQRLNALTTGGPVTTLANTPLDGLIDQVRERLRADGFKLEIIDEREPASPPVQPELDPAAVIAAATEAVTEPKPRGRPRKANGVTPEVVTEPPSTMATPEDEDDPLTPKKKSKAPSKPLIVLDEANVEPDPAGDRQHVLDTLAGILKDPKAKDRVLSFASGMAKKHGKDKISELPVDPFPEIRRAMEKEFPNA